MAILALVFMLSACASVNKYAPAEGDLYDQQYAVLDDDSCSAFDDFLDKNEDILNQQNRKTMRMITLCTGMGLFLGVEDTWGREEFVSTFVLFNKKKQPNRTKLTPEGKANLKMMSYYLQALYFAEEYTCKVYVQTDGSGGTDLNQSLSYDRGVFIKKSLENDGVGCDVVVVAKGEGPACPDDGYKKVLFGPHRMFKANDCRFGAILISLKEEGDRLMLQSVKRNLRRRDLRGAY